MPAEDGEDLVPRHELDAVEPLRKLAQLRPEEPLVLAGEQNLHVPLLAFGDNVRQMGIVKNLHDIKADMRIIRQNRLHATRRFGAPGEGDRNLANTQFEEDLPHDIAQRLRPKPRRQARNRHNRARILQVVPREAQKAHQEQVRENGRHKEPPELFHGRERHGRVHPVAVIEPADGVHADEERNNRPKFPVNGGFIGIDADKSVVKDDRRKPHQEKRQGIRRHEREHPETSRRQRMALRHIAMEDNILEFLPQARFRVGGFRRGASQPSHFTALFRIAQKFLQGVRECRAVLTRHDQSALCPAHDFRRHGAIRHDHRPRRGHRFQHDETKRFLAGRHDGEGHVLEESRLVRDPARPAHNVREPLLFRLRLQGRPVGAVPADHEPERHAARLELRARIQEDVHALGRDEPPEKADDGYRPLRRRRGHSGHGDRIPAAPHASHGRPLDPHQFVPHGFRHGDDAVHLPKAAHVRVVRHPDNPRAARQKRLDEPGHDETDRPVPVAEDDVRRIPPGIPENLKIRREVEARGAADRQAADIRRDRVGRILVADHARDVSARGEKPGILVGDRLQSAASAAEHDVEDRHRAASSRLR